MEMEVVIVAETPIHWWKLPAAFAASALCAFSVSTHIVAETKVAVDFLLICKKRSTLYQRISKLNFLPPSFPCSLELGKNIVSSGNACRLNKVCPYFLMC